MNRWLCAFLLAVSASAQTAVPWLTRNHDNQRSGWNNQETILTQASVAKGIVIKGIIPVYGDARGVEAQPLILPQVTTKNGVQDVMVLCSMANQCRGVDVHSGSDIWDVTLGMPATGDPSIDSHLINHHWGPLSTGVIDPADKRFYQVFWSSPDGTGNPQTARFYMAVLNVSNGSQVVPPVLIQGTANGDVFNSQMRKARSSAVLLTQGTTRTVLQCTGTVSESGNGANGFCFAFDTFTNRVTTMVATTMGEGAGIWEAGGGLSCDPLGNFCYAVTGNGDFDGVTQWGESFIQIKYTPPTAKTAAAIVIAKGWSPWTDLQRSGQAQVPIGKLAGVSMPSEASRPVGGGMSVSLSSARLVANFTSTGTPNVNVYPAMASGNWSDEDWGSSGPACIFQIGYCVAAGKDGIGYVLPVPGFTGTTASTVGTTGNCLYANPVWFTVDPGNITPCPVDPADLNFFPGGYTAHLHATPVQFLNPITNTWNIAAGGENQQVHIWNVSNSGKLSYLGEGNEYASSDLRGKPPGGMTGSHCVGSSDGLVANTYLLVCVQPYGNSNTAVVPGHIIIYDPVHITNGVMPTLWDSGDWGAHVPGNQWSCMQDKFLPPIIDAGEIIEPCYDGRIMVLGLAN